MLNKEKNCSWHFDPQPRGGEKGPNDPNALKFQGTPYHSLIRESIQNSLDAVKDKTKPVIVSFDYREFNGWEYPRFFDLKQHIEGCLKKYQNDDNAKRVYEPMLKFFNVYQSKQNIGYLRVTDYNTIGMSYDKHDPKSLFNAFISEGIASKPNGAGGAFGFGKAVFWMKSPFSSINTVFVSSKVSDKECYFVGQAKLCTHTIDGIHDLAPNGLYSTNGAGEVITNEADIPDEFKPKEIGTTICCLGSKPIDDETRRHLIRAVLRNFWFAIYEQKLIVRIDGIEINTKNLPIMMEEYFPESPENGIKERHIDEYNPRNYFDIVKTIDNGKADDNYKLICQTLDIDNEHHWKVKLYLHKDEEAKGLYEFMRSPLMTVYIEKHSEWKGTEGIFVCDDDDGNKCLREMEDSAHDSWSRQNYKARGNEDDLAKDALNKIKEFITNNVHNELHTQDQETADVSGLEDLLYTSSENSLKYDKGATIVDPNSIEDDKPRKTKAVKNPPQVQKRIKTKAVFDEHGRLRSNSGSRTHKPRRIPPGPIPTGNMKGKMSENSDGKEGIYAKPVDVTYRSWAHKDDSGRLWHTIRIFSNERIDNAIIQVFGIDDEGKQIGLNIEEANGYNIRYGEVFEDSTDFNDNSDVSLGRKKQVKNAIDGVTIKPGIPTDVDIRFNSNIQYSLRIFSDIIVTGSDENK